MLKLCGFHISNYHNKVRLALLEKGTAFDEDANCKPSQKELVGRRLFGGAFFGGTTSEETKKEVERDLAKGVRAFAKLAKFDPYIAGKDFTLADCSAFVNLPLITMATKISFGKDALEGIQQVKPYFKMLGERPHFRRVQADRKAASEAAAAAKKAD